MLGLIAATLIAAAPARAQQVALDPLNRVHAGVSAVQQGGLGLMAGMDSRMTRVVSVDVGGFLSANAPAAPVVPDGGDYADAIVLRHALYVAPGLRVPHRYRKGLNWDFTVRAGFAAAWSQDASADHDRLTDPALLGGAGLMLRERDWGLRASARELYFKPWSRLAREEVRVLRWQAGLEAFYQW